VDARSLSLSGILLLAACRGAAPGGDAVANSAAAVTARTWGLAYLQQNQLPEAEADKFAKALRIAAERFGVFRLLREPQPRCQSLFAVTLRAGPVA